LRRFEKLMHVIAHTFQPRDLVGGHVAIDLVNTVTARNADPIDWLDGYARLVEWAMLTGEFPEGTLRFLERRSSSDPAGARRALARARDLREVLHAILTAMIRSEAAPQHELHRYEVHAKAALAHATISTAPGHVRLEASIDTSGLELVTHRLILRSLDLLREVSLDRTRICAGDRCGWLFIDRSKGGRRRWCDMSTCGNTAKSRRHYLRTRSGS
jgi:predicted RNA-binding Zn ribbon-like protein